MGASRSAAKRKQNLLFAVGSILEQRMDWLRKKKALRAARVVALLEQVFADISFYLN